MHRRMTVSILLVLAIVVALTAVTLTTAPAAAASAAHLTRYPYLTDVVSNGTTYNATLNWATNQARHRLRDVRPDWRRVHPAHRANGSKTSITVNGVHEYQWKAKITAAAGHRRTLPGVLQQPDLRPAGRGRVPPFTTPPPPGGAAPFSFAVFGDWGATDSTGANPNQANLDALIAASGASFALSTGDVGYSGGSQTNYGDLFQTGASISSVFGPSFYKEIGDGIPMFPAPGNHGFNSTFLNVWPQPTAPRLSGGKYPWRPTASPARTPPAIPPLVRLLRRQRTLLRPDRGVVELERRRRHAVLERLRGPLAAHSAEYQWLAKRPRDPPGGAQVRLLPLPDVLGQPVRDDRPLSARSRQSGPLLTQYGVQFVFNGHAHIYERNYQLPGESFVSYVTGAGGEPLEPLGTTSPSTPTGSAGATRRTRGATGCAPRPTSKAQVFRFLLVTVDGTR